MIPSRREPSRPPAPQTNVVQGRLRDMRPLFLAATALLFLSAASTAQTATQTTAAPTPGATKYRFVVSIVDEKGKAIEDVGDQDVKAELGRQPVAVNSVVRYHQAPIRIVIVLDESGSMKQTWPEAVAIVVELLKSLPKNSSVGLIGANDKPPEVLIHPESIINYLKNRLQRGHEPEGQTALWDIVHQALLTLGKPRAT